MLSRRPRGAGRSGGDTGKLVDGCPKGFPTSIAFVGCGTLFVVSTCAPASARRTSEASANNLWTAMQIGGAHSRDVSRRTALSIVRPLEMSPRGIVMYLPARMTSMRFAQGVSLSIAMPIALRVRPKAFCSAHRSWRRSAPLNPIAARVETRLGFQPRACLRSRRHLRGAQGRSLDIAAPRNASELRALEHQRIDSNKR
jgi:hypothetical protein